ncbi:phage tail protein [Lutibacter sp.]|uniref:phage tail protein n=1 Tax=Lutibacter sp. TaxID=1925666 RepID=UPI00356AEEDC
MDPFLAEIIMFGGNFAPRGWAFCDGQLLPISSNQALFSILGTTYGGDGRTTFALPDLRGRVPIHPGTGNGLSTYRLGQKGGTQTNTLTTNNLPSHSHTINIKEEGNSDNPNGTFIAGDGSNSFGTTSDASNTLAASAVNPSGGSQAVNNIQPFECVNFIIALTGIFPSRN